MLNLKNIGKRLIWVLCIVIGTMYFTSEVKAQRLALKTNALEYAVLSPNLTLEARLSSKFSLQLGIGTHPSNLSIADTKLTNFRIEPELRYWFNRPMAKHFIALSATAANYSLRHKDHYFNGDALAAGISYGYALVLSKHWNMEAEIGVGLGSFKGYDYTGKDNKPAQKNYSRILIVPIRIGLSFGYVF